MDLGTGRKALLATLYMRYFGWSKIPLIAFVKPSVVKWTDEELVVKIPLRRATKNHLNCMYFGALAVGADLAGGFMAMAAIRDSGEKINLIFKDLHADFLKRAEGDVHFSCAEGTNLKKLVQQAIQSGERVEMPVTVIATVPSKFGDEPVARFVLTLSLKKKEKKA